jgi:hypothetical protein
MTRASGGNFGRIVSSAMPQLPPVQVAMSFTQGQSED